jgi:hypothetical protein
MTGCHSGMNICLSLLKMKALGHLSVILVIPVMASTDVSTVSASHFSVMDVSSPPIIICLLITLRNGMDSSFNLSTLLTLVLSFTLGTMVRLAHMDTNHPMTSFFALWILLEYPINESASVNVLIPSPCTINCCTCTSFLQQLITLKLFSPSLSWIDFTLNLLNAKSLQTTSLAN